MKKTFYFLMLTSTVISFVPLTISAQVVSLGADVMSRYIWRGTDFGNSPSVQPALSFKTGGLTFGMWAAYPIVPSNSGVEEQNLFVAFTRETGVGEFSLVLTDYYYPNAGIKFSEFEGDGKGAHTFEISGSFSGTINLFGAVNIHNDVSNSVYLEVGYPFSKDGISLEAFAGFSVVESLNWYLNKDFAAINTGITASKEIELTDKLSLPVTASFVLNPDQEITHFVFGISF